MSVGFGLGMALLWTWRRVAVAVAVAVVTWARDAASHTRWAAPVPRSFDSGLKTVGRRRHGRGGGKQRDERTKGWRRERERERQRQRRDVRDVETMHESTRCFESDLKKTQGNKRDEGGEGDKERTTEKRWEQRN